MATLLPPIPKLIFTILEPISLVAGFVSPILYPSYFITSQLTRPYPLPINETTHLLAQQLGNCYLLLGLLGLFILNTTSELKVVKAYLWALWLGDIGHVGITLYAMGWADSMDVGKWNAVIWGNIGATTFLFISRCLYLGGLFDKEEKPSSPYNLRSRKRTTPKKSR